MGRNQVVLNTWSAQRGLQLFESGDDALIQISRFHDRVRKESGRGYWDVKGDGWRWTCSCPGFQKRSQLCAHMWAIELATKIRAAREKAMPHGVEVVAVPDAPIRVLFVCTHNSARSQIAEALLGRYGGEDFEVSSAGTEATRVNPFAIRALAELGIDWSAARSKRIDEFLDQRFDYVITVCDRARETCPVFPGSMNSLHWGLDDPSEVEGTDAERLAAFRRTQVEVSARLRPFIEVALRAAGRTPRSAVAG